MTRIFRRRTGAVWGLLVVVALGGCSHTYQEREANYKDVAIARAPGEVPDSQLVDVRIKSFEPAPISEDKDKSAGISKEIRKVEAYYAAVQLSKKMQETGYWGAVRVVPADYTDGELLVSGKVLESDGEILRLEVKVADATGTEWFDRDYSGVIDQAAYEAAKKKGEDPFGFIYTQISNDISKYRAGLEPKQVENIREVAKLRFAADFAPDAFKGYVKEKPKDSGGGFFGSVVSSLGGSDESSGGSAKPEGSGHYEAVRLPSKDDPMMKRVERIRARQDLVVDALDQEYESLARQVGDAYTQWRSSRLTEMDALRKVETKRDEEVGKSVALAVVGILAGVAVGRNCQSCGGAIVGATSAVALQNAMQATSQASADQKMHKAALEEIGQSLAADVKPVVVQVEGQTVELRGTAEQKFSQWRRIMKRLYRQEVGPLKDKVGPGSSATPGGSGTGAPAGAGGSALEVPNG